MPTFAAETKKETKPVARGQASRGPQGALLQASTVLRQSGEPLDAATRGWMEPRFGFDFGAIRIHADENARRSAEALNADAYTVGRHIVLGSARPSTALLAHELTHAVQQRQVSGPMQSPVEVAPAASTEERQAHEVGRRVAQGASAGPIACAGPGSLARLHRAEKGTYVSNVGEKPYLDAGFAFYKHWGYPNVKRVSSMEEVVSDLAVGTGHIDKFRIVAHGAGGSFQIKFFKDVEVSHFAENEASFRDAQRFRTATAEVRLVNDTTLTAEINDLIADPTAGPLLAAVGVLAVPALDSPMGLFLRGVLEQHFLGEIRLTGGAKPASIPNRAVLNQLIATRKAYRSVIINAAPAADRAKISTALTQLEAAVPAALAGKRTFEFSQADIDALADPFLESGAATPALSKEISRIAKEGADGTYVTNLAKARKRMDETTHIEIRGCTVGEDPDFMDKVRLHFGAPPDHLPSISAPDLFQYFFQVGDVATFRFDQAADQARFATDYPTIQNSWIQMERVRRHEAWPVTNETSLKEFANRYRWNLNMLRLLNPEYDAREPRMGELVWLVLRPGIPLDDAAKELAKGGARGTIGKNWNAPPIDDSLAGAPRSALLPESFPQVSYPPVYPQTPDQASLQKNLEGGGAFVSLEAGKVLVRLDDKKRATAFASWLAAQGFDARKRSAADLQKGMTGNFGDVALGTHVEFLAPDYPEFAVKDILFPTDPRYSYHIIQRP